MKKSIVLFGLLLSLIANSQKQSWTTYFPVSNDVVGHTFIGSNPMDAKVQEDVENVSIKTETSANTLTKDQKDVAVFSWNNLFKNYKLKISDINAYGVKIDKITKETQDDMSRNIPFVYAALRGDSSTITFKKYKADTIQSAPIIDSIKKIFPKITETELGKFIDFLKFTYQTKDTIEYNMTIKDSSVYFLVQVAEIDKTGGDKWDKYCASFLSRDKPYHFVENFTLIDSLDFYKTGYAQTHFSWTTKLFNNVQKAKVWLEIDKEKNLVVHSQISPTEKEKTKIITERNGTWHYDNIVVRTYPYSAGNNSEDYKDIILIINAHRDGNKIIIESGATDKACGETYLNYPQSEFVWKRFRL